MNLEQGLKDAAYVVMAFSVLHILLPPVELFAPYPRFQKAYGVFVDLVGWCAVNWRLALTQVTTASVTRSIVTTPAGERSVTTSASTSTVSETTPSKG